MPKYCPKVNRLQHKVPQETSLQTCKVVLNAILHCSSRFSFHLLSIHALFAFFLHHKKKKIHLKFFHPQGGCFKFVFFSSWVQWKSVIQQDSVGGRKKDHVKGVTSRLVHIESFNLSCRSNSLFVIHIYLLHP